MRNDNEDLIQRITTIEQQLRELRIELEESSQQQESPDQDIKGTLQLGDRVRIKNPKRSQPSVGILTKIHQRTRRGTVTSKNKKGNDILIVRLLHNLEKH